MPVNFSSVSAQDGIVAIGKAHTHSAPSLGSLHKVALETVPICVCLNADCSRPWRVDVGLLLSVSVSAQDGIVALGKAHTRSALSLSSLQGCPRNSANVCLVEHRLFSALEGGMSTASFLHSSFLQAINAVILWPVHVEKVPQASEHLCLAKLQSKCDVCGACQSICPFIPTDSGMPRAVDPQKSLQLKTARL